MQTLLTPYLNTSYVDIKPLKEFAYRNYHDNLNTAYVDIKLMSI